MAVSAIALVVRGLTLPNSLAGINSLFSPDLSALTNPNVWLAAFGQAMFSLSLCMGIMVTYSSYLKKGSEIVNTTYVVAIIDMLFALVFSIGIFAILGYLAGAQGVGVGEVAAGGAGLVFVTLPVALNYMGPFGNIMGVAFFTMLLVTGWTSFLSLMESFMAPFTEKFGWNRKKAFRNLSIVGFLASLIYCTGAGQLVLTLVDYGVNTFGLTLIGVCQAAMVAWVAKKLPEFQAWGNARTLPGFRLGALYLFQVKFFVPAIIGLSLVLAVLRFFGVGTTVLGTAPAAILARSAAEIAVFVGGTILLAFAVGVILMKKQWSININDYEKE